MEQTVATNLLDLDPQALARFFEELGEKPYRATQVIKWLHQQGAADFDAMTNLSKALRESLAERARIHAPEVTLEKNSLDGTRKWLMRVDSGNQIETVFIPEKERGTLCISSQVGCPLDCQFCATAKQGFNRNLSPAEIIGQLWHVSRALGQTTAKRLITNIVMMGMGEPLLNFDNVTAAIRMMLNDNAYGLGRRRVTVSTAGVIPGIYRLARECPVSLAVSLHATTDAQRDQIVPLNRKYPLAELLQACQDYARIADIDHITFEYVMLAGVNDSLDDAKRLVRLLEPVPSKVNLIPFNPFPGAAYECSERAQIDAFQAVLQRAGLLTTTRKTRGDDIAAACGQLVGDVKARGGRARRAARGVAA